jgi:hypothetical protein
MPVSSVAAMQSLEANTQSKKGNNLLDNSYVGRDSSSLIQCRRQGRKFDRQKIKTALYGLPERNFFLESNFLFSGSSALLLRRAGPSATSGGVSRIQGDFLTLRTAKTTDESP